MSDNGYTWGEQRLFGKSCPYQECVRVPLVISYPPLTPLRVDDDRLVLNIDLAPTILDLAGLPPSPTADGMSMLPLFGEASDWRTDFLIEGWPQGSNDPPPFSGVVSRDWSYVEYQTVERELYDLLADPYQMTNLADAADTEPQRLQLATRLAELRGPDVPAQADGEPTPESP